MTDRDGDDLLARVDAECDCPQCGLARDLVAEVRRLRAENERLEAKAESCRKQAKRSGNRRREMQRSKAEADRNTAIVAELRDRLRAELDRARPVLGTDDE